MRAAWIAILLPAAFVQSAAAVGFDQYASIRIETDSMGIDPGRRLVVWNGLLEGPGWELGISERLLDADSGGTVPRWLLGRSDLQAEGRAWLGPVTLNPSVRWSTEIREGLQLVLPVPQAGTAFDRGFMKPAFSAGVDLPSGLSVTASGSLQQRDLEMPDGTAPGWSTTQLGGTLGWDAPRGFELYAGGRTSSTDAEDIGWTDDWSRLDFGVLAGPVSLPARTQVLGDIRFTSWDGEDYLEGALGQRVTCSARAARWLNPSLSVNVTGRAGFDRRDGEWCHSLSAGIARVNYVFGLPSANPTSITLGGMYTVSAITTARLEASTRIHLFAGLSALLSGDFRSGPSVVPGGPASRRRAVLGSGLEYRFGTSAVVWARVEDERTELSRIEDWARLEAGLEITP